MGEKLKEWLTVGGRQEVRLLALVLLECANCVLNHPYISGEAQARKAAALCVEFRRADSAVGADCKFQSLDSRAARI